MLSFWSFVDAADSGSAGVFGDCAVAGSWPPPLHTAATTLKHARNAARARQVEDLLLL